MTPSTSPPWSTTTKALVAASALVLSGIVIWAFRGLLQQLVLAALLAYLLHPLVSLLDRHTRIRRSSAVLLVYFSILIVTLIILSIVGITTVQEAALLFDRLPVLIDRSPELFQDLVDRIPEAIAIGPFRLAIEPDRLLGFLPNSEEIVQAISEQLGSLVANVISRGSTIALGALGVVGATVNIVGLLFLVFVISIYIAIDLPRYGDALGELAHVPGYREDVRRLVRSISRVWASYLRGQVILGLIIFVLVSLTLSLLRVNNAIGLGLLSGAMEFLPVIGPLIGAGAAILVALFQPETAYGMTQLQFALAVAVAMFIIQQIENNLLVPRIVGDALDLHPLLVMVSVIMGATLAGLLGAVLAAPVVASLRVLGAYAWRKMFDMPPFDEEDDPLLDVAEPGILARLGGFLQARAVPVQHSISSSAPSMENKVNAQMDLYPLDFAPIFKDYVWGGRRLESQLGRTIPAGRIAESWEIAAHANGESQVASGVLAGKSLDELRRELGDQLMGTDVDGSLDRFPLLIKLLDANEWLSVQVHPDDAYALEHENDLGKNEMWIVLDAEPDAEIIFGLAEAVSAESFRLAAETGRIQSCLQRIRVETGDIFYVPAGAVHALGPGLLVAEIQQNSDTTYRIYDWDRTGDDGVSRPLHLDKALRVIDWNFVRPGPVQPSPISLTGLEGGIAELIVDSDYFRCERIRFEMSGTFRGTCQGSRFEIWGLLRGRADLSWGRERESLEAVSWRLLPAAMGDYAIDAHGASELIRVTV